MILFNPTPEEVDGGFNAHRYRVIPGHTVELPDMIGLWLLSHEEKKGLVRLDTSGFDIKTKEGKSALQRYIVQRSYDGLEKYIELKNEVLQQWINLDTEIKSQNQFGTVLQSKSVKEVTKWIEIATGMIKDLEKKYAVDFKRDEILEKSNVLQMSIDDIVKQFESDAEKKAESLKMEKEINSVIDSILPKQPKVTGNHSVSI